MNQCGQSFTCISVKIWTVISHPRDAAGKETTRKQKRGKESNCIKASEKQTPRTERIEQKKRDLAFHTVARNEAKLLCEVTKKTRDQDEDGEGKHSTNLRVYSMT